MPTGVRYLHEVKEDFKQLTRGNEDEDYEPRRISKTDENQVYCGAYVYYQRRI
jgi:hypothetical protein